MFEIHFYIQQFGFQEQTYISKKKIILTHTLPSGALESKPACAVENDG